jgi:hypothetical protein
LGTNQPLILNNAEQDPRHYALVSDHVKFKINTLLGVPMLGAVAGLLFLRRSLWIGALAFVALALLVLLAWYSRDEVFSSCALGLILAAALARLLEKGLVR